MMNKTTLIVLWSVLIVVFSSVNLNAQDVSSRTVNGQVTDEVSGGIFNRRICNVAIH